MSVMLPRFPVAFLVVLAFVSAGVGCARAKPKEKPVPMEASDLEKIRTSQYAFSPRKRTRDMYVLGLQVDNLTDKEIASVTIEFIRLLNDKVVYRKDLTWNSFTDVTNGYVGSLEPNSSVQPEQILQIPDTIRANAYWYELKSATYYKKGDDLADFGHLFAAVSSKNNAKVEAALKEDPSLAKARDPVSGITILDQCAICDNLELAKLVHEKGAPIDYVLKNGSTPLFVALLNNSSRMAEWLIDQGVDTTGVRNSKTVLQLAAQVPSATITEKLIARGAKIDAPNTYWNSPLAIASRWGNLAVVKVLLKHHANPNAPDRFYGTPLHAAASSDNT
ncbi:MAG: hypothetical protein QOJ65_491, partial [Fimbriimonadaceae bacterium]|nr:hypothetical protein [Fimbriimonadaceae bacterium]